MVAARRRSNFTGRTQKSRVEKRRNPLEGAMQNLGLILLVFAFVVACIARLVDRLGADRRHRQVGPGALRTRTPRPARMHERSRVLWGTCAPAVGLMIEV
jgi:hypothetical protein